MGRPRKIGPGIASRIAELIPEGETQAEFAKRLGFPETTVSNYTRGDRIPTADFLSRLREIAGADMNWIVSGEKPAGNPVAVGRNEVAIARYSVHASAGNGAVVLAEEVADWFRVGRDWLERYVPRGARTGVIEARGDSMEPTISDGDILLLNFDVDRQDVANGGVFVITIDGNLFVKRLQIMLDGSIMIRSDNERYEPERVDREYADEKMLVHARVVWSGGPLR